MGTNTRDKRARDDLFTSCCCMKEWSRSGWLIAWRILFGVEKGGILR